MAAITKKNIKAHDRRLAQEALEPKRLLDAVSASASTPAAAHESKEKPARTQGTEKIPTPTLASDHRTKEGETERKDQGASPKEVLVTKYSAVTSNLSASSSKLPVESPAKEKGTTRPLQRGRDPCTQRNPVKS